MSNISLYTALILSLGLVCQWVAWRVKLPAILFLLLTGLFLGSGSGLLDPDLLLGNGLFPFVSMSIAIILFEGSLTLNFRELRGMAQVVRSLVSTGALITWLLIAVSTHYIINLSWQMSILFAAIVVVTGPTVIMPMLKSVRPTQKVANVLRWEGIVIDPIGAMLAVLVYEYLTASQSSVAISHTLLIFMRIILIGGFSGIVGGVVLGTLIKRRWLPEYLHNFLALSLVLLFFSLSNTLEHESGLIAVTVMGIVLANMKNISLDGIYDFKEHLSVLLISCLFIILAARIDPNKILELGMPIVYLLLIMQFLIRPIVIMICTFKSDFTWQEKSLLAWIAPRGIVAAAISALFALRMEEAGYTDAQTIVTLTFAVILGTVLMQSATAGVLARFLGVSEPSPRGILFVGANHIARELAFALKENDFRVLMADTSWEAIRQARMIGLETFYGNPLSEYAEDKMNLIGIGHLISATPQSDLNALAALRFKPEFGAHNIFSIATGKKQTNSNKHAVSREQRAHFIGNNELTFSKISSLIKQGAKVRSTTLTDTYNFSHLSEEKKIHPLFALDKKDSFKVFTDDQLISPKTGWTVISLDYQDIADNV
jgi:NhaP-type Na+/H+ or K+/H+ antiporter